MKRDVRSAYIHIPFCRQICSYCDFCKMYKNDEVIYKYLDALELEIKKNYKGEVLDTLYIGGGTPSSLDLRELERLFEIIDIFNLSGDAEISFEANVEDLSVSLLLFLKNKVNRLSIGVQTFSSNLIGVLGRREVDISKVRLAHEYFPNINIDLMYGFKEESLDVLKKDIEVFLSLSVPHISVYSLILEPHTKLYIDGYEPDFDKPYEKVINEMLGKAGYIHYEVSNYALKGYESRHNLTYWNNNQYYGFGLGASGYITDLRYENTRSINKYLNGDYLYSSHILDMSEVLENEFILGLRKISGIKKDEFYEKYGKDIYFPVVLDLLSKGYLIDIDGFIRISPKYIYLSNEILIYFLDAFTQT